MQDNMMLAPMAAHHVPILPLPNSAPMQIHLNDDMNNNNIDRTDVTSKTTISPAQVSAKSTSVKMQMKTPTVGSATESTSQVVISEPAQTQTASVEVKMDNNTDKITMPKPVEETSSASQISPEDPGGDSTISVPARNATSKASPEEETDDSMVVGATTTPPPNNEISIGTEIEGNKPEVAEVEAVKATTTEPTNESIAASEPVVSNIEASETMDLDAVDHSDDKGKNAVSEDHDPHAQTTEVTQTRGGSDHEQVVSTNISPADDPTPNPDSSPDASQSSDRTTQDISRLHATYCSSGKSRVSERKEGKTEVSTVLGAQAENCFPDETNIMVPEPIPDHNSTITTSESAAEREEEEMISLDKPPQSLFGGPLGKQISPTVGAPHTLNVGPVAQTETADGFKEIFEDEMVGISAETNSRLQESNSFDIKFDFEASNADEDAQLNNKEDIEFEAVLGAQRDISSLTPSSDHDAKPDISAFPRASSPAHSNISSTTSQLSHRTKASVYQSLVNSVVSGEAYLQELHNQPTFEESFGEEQTFNASGHTMLGSIEEVQPYDRELEHPATYRRVQGRILRPLKENCALISSTVLDTDTSGDYNDESKQYPSSKEVAWEDRDDDEVTIEDGAEDHLLSGGLVSDDTDLVGRSNTRISYNKTDPVIKDKMAFEEESSSEDESASKSSKKRKKKAKAIKEVTRPAKRPRVANITDDESDGRPPHPLSRTSMTTKRTASKIRDAQRQRSPVLVREPHPLSQAAKPTKKTASKKKKDPANSSQTQQSPTIMQIVQRLAKPLITKLSYPVHFNSRTSCSICQCPSYAIIGIGSTRNIKIYDFGSGNREISDANEAGKSQPLQPRPEETSLCMDCTTKYMRVLMCKTHDVVPLDVHSVFDSSAAFNKAVEKRCTKDELKGWCSLCPAPASYCCDKNCGAKFCDTCAPTLYGEHEGNLTAMLDKTEDKISPEYKHGLRADAELLRKGGELEKFLVRMAGASKNRTG